MRGGEIPEFRRVAVRHREIAPTIWDGVIPDPLLPAQLDVELAAAAVLGGWVEAARGRGRRPTGRAR